MTPTTTHSLVQIIDNKRYVSEAGLIRARLGLYCLWFRLSYFRGPLGVGDLTTTPRAKIKRNHHQTTKPPPQTKGPTNQLQATKAPPNKETATATATRDILFDIPPRADYRHWRNAIPNHMLHFSATPSDVITCVGVTQFIAMRSSLYLYNIGR